MSIKDRLVTEAYPNTEIWNRLKDYLIREVMPMLDQRFPAIQVMGSHSKGYATLESDVDFKLYFHGVIHSDSLVVYRTIQDILSRDGWRVCRTGPHVEDHHIVHLDGIDAQKVSVIPFVPPRVYVFLCSYDLVWLHSSIRQCMNIADLFTGGFVKHQSMDFYRNKVLKDLNQNSDLEKVWKVINALYVGHVSRINLKKHGISRKEQKVISQLRKERFKLPSLELLVG